MNEDGQNPVRVFVCEDASSLRQLIRAWFELDPGVMVVGEARDAGDIVSALDSTAAEVLVLDLALMDHGGLEVLPLVRAAAPGLAIVVYSGFSARRMEDEALRLGADIYLEKSTPLGVLRERVLALGLARRAAAG